MPLYTTDENMYFREDIGLTPALVLDSTDPENKKMVQWDKIPTSVQSSLEDTITVYGGIPVAPVAGSSAINFDSTVAGGNPTGFSDDATSGSQLINCGGLISGTDATGFITVTNTASTLPINFTASKLGADATGLSNALQTLATGTVNGADVNGNILFTSDLVGALGNAVTVTFVDPSLVSQPLTVGVVGNAITVSLATDAGGVITTTGGAATIAINADVNANVLVTASNVGTGMSLSVASPLVTLSGGSDAVTYNATINGESVAVVGNTAQTFTDLLTQMNIALTATTATLTGTSITITHNTLGANNITVVDTDLFSSLTDFSSVGTVILGLGGNNTYTTTITIDGADTNINLDGNTHQTVNDVITSINTALASGNIAIVDGDLVISSVTTSATSTVLVSNDQLFHKLTNYVIAEAPIDGLNSTVYIFGVVVDDNAQIITVSAKMALTFTTLINVLNAELTGAVAAFSGSSITITSNSTGKLSTVEHGAKCFEDITGFVNIVAYRGVDDIFDLLRFNKHTNGSSFNELLAVLVVGVGSKPKGLNNFDSTLTYWNGTAWVNYYNGI